MYYIFWTSELLYVKKPQICYKKSGLLRYLVVIYESILYYDLFNSFMTELPPCRNQPIDLLCKIWFPYDRNLDREGVNTYYTGKLLKIEKVTVKDEKADQLKYL